MRRFPARRALFFPALLCAVCLVFRLRRPFCGPQRHYAPTGQRGQRLQQPLTVLVHIDQRKGRQVPVLVFHQAPITHLGVPPRATSCNSMKAATRRGKNPTAAIGRRFISTGCPAGWRATYAKRHTPEICLTAMGLKLLSGPHLTMLKIHGMELPVNSYLFNSLDGPLQVFHCRWEAGVGNNDYVARESTRFSLVRAVWAGRGNQGQKVLEFAIFGIKDPDQAQKALARQLEKLIEVKPANAA